MTAVLIAWGTIGLLAAVGAGTVLFLTWPDEGRLARVWSARVLLLSPVWPLLAVWLAWRYGWIGVRSLVLLARNREEDL